MSKIEGLKTFIVLLLKTVIFISFGFYITRKKEKIVFWEEIIFLELLICLKDRYIHVIGCLSINTILALKNLGMVPVNSRWTH